MEHFGSVFLADNGSSSFNRNMWERLVDHEYLTNQKISNKERW